MEENYKKIIEDIESSIKLRPSQRAILKVIENSFENGEIDSAVELTNNLGRGLKTEDKKKFDTTLTRIKLVPPSVKTTFSTAITSPSSDVQKNLKSESGMGKKNKPGDDFLKTSGEVIEIESPLPMQELVIDDSEFTKDGEYNSLGVDLVPRSDKNATIEIGEAAIQIGNLSSGGKDKSDDDYSGLELDSIPEKEQLKSFLDQLSKEVKSFAGAGELEKDKDDSEEVTDDDIERILEKSSEADAMLMIEDEGTKAGSHEKSKGGGGKKGGKEDGVKIEEKPLNSPDIMPALDAHSIASSGNLIDSAALPSVSTPGQIQFEYAPMPIYQPYDGSQIVDSDKMGETMGDGNFPIPPQSPFAGTPTGTGSGSTKDDGLGGALKEALKESLSGIFEDAISGFKDDNKELYDAVERKKKKEPSVMNNLLEDEQEYDEGKPWMRDAKDTDVKVHSFGDTKDEKDESVGKYEVYDDEQEVESFKDVNKDLFEDVDKKDRTPKKVEDQVKEAYNDVDDIKVETKTNTDGAREIVFTNMGEQEKKKRPPKKPPKRVRLSFSFRNLFNNKTYIKYKEILNTAAILVAEKKLDEALDYYYTIRDQNIPNVFKMMVQQNIDDIEETIMRTFQYSDTIVKVKDSGRAIRLRDLNEFERQIEEERLEELSKKRGEVFYDEDEDDELAYEE
jgi:hypothetical protein